MIFNNKVANNTTFFTLGVLASTFVNPTNFISHLFIGILGIFLGMIFRDLDNPEYSTEKEALIWEKVTNFFLNILNHAKDKNIPIAEVLDGFKHFIQEKCEHKRNGIIQNLTQTETETTLNNNVEHNPETNSFSWDLKNKK